MLQALKQPLIVQQLQILRLQEVQQLDQRPMEIRLLVHEDQYNSKVPMVMLALLVSIRNHILLWIFLQHGVGPVEIRRRGLIVIPVSKL